jgi:hypothetical protein
MSRGIGRLQQDILDELTLGGRWRLAADLISALWKPDGRTGKPARSFQVSAWRAIAGLRKRGLVKTASSLSETGSTDADHILSKFRKNLAVWLPHHQQPEWIGQGDLSGRRPPNRVRIVGSSYEGVVMTILRQVSPGEIRYSDLWNQACHTFRSDADRHRVALRRAIDRLEKKGLIGTLRSQRRTGECVVRLWLMGK